MKIKEGFVVREIAGQTVVVALGKASESFHGIIKLNESGKFIWEMLSKGAERDEIIEAMLDEYDTERNVVTADVDAFIEVVKGADLFE